MVRYHYATFKPKGLLNRLLVRMHRYSSDVARSWKSGAFFEHKGNQLLAEEPYGSTEIVLRARGVEPKELLTLIAADLDALNDSFGALRDKVEKKIPCVCSQCRQSTQPFFYDYARLKKRREKGRLLVECEDSFEKVEVTALLDGIFNNLTNALTNNELETLLTNGEVEKVLRYFQARQPEAVGLLARLAEAKRHFGDGRISYTKEYDQVFNQVVAVVRGWL